MRAAEPIALLALFFAACTSARSPAPEPQAWDYPPSIDATHCSTEATGAESPELLPRACAHGEAASCLALSKVASASVGDHALVLYELERRCADSGCACWAYGEVLASDPSSEPARAIHVLRDACVKGVSNACDRLYAITVDCAWGDAKREGLCDVLRAEGRLPDWIHRASVGATTLPPELEGCFDVLREVGRASPIALAAVEEVDDTQLGNICEIDPRSCRIAHPPNPQHYTNFCAISPTDCPSDRTAIAVHALCKVSGDLLRACNSARSRRVAPAEKVRYCFTSDEVRMGERGALVRRTSWFADLDKPSLYVSPLGLGLHMEDVGVVLEHTGGTLLLARANEQR